MRTAPFAVGLQLGERLVLDDDFVALCQLHLNLLVLVHGRQERLGGQHGREGAVLGLPCPARNTIVMPMLRIYLVFQKPAGVIMSVNPASGVTSHQT